MYTITRLKSIARQAFQRIRQKRHIGGNENLIKKKWQTKKGSNKRAFSDTFIIANSNRPAANGLLCSFLFGDKMKCFPNVPVRAYLPRAGTQVVLRATTNFGAENRCFWEDPVGASGSTLSCDELITRHFPAVTIIPSFPKFSPGIGGFHSSRKRTAELVSDRVTLKTVVFQFYLKKLASSVQYDWIIDKKKKKGKKQTNETDIRTLILYRVGQ